MRSTSESTQASGSEEKDEIMTYRKTWFDYVLWAVYAGLCIMLLAFVGNELYAFYVGEPLAVLGAFLPFPVLLCLYPAIRQAGWAIRKRYRLSSHFSAIAESLAVSVAFVFGMILRLKEGYVVASLYELETGAPFEPSDYYELAMVRAGGGGFSFVHGISDLFVKCLRVVLSFLGNSVEAAILFQIFLQLLAMLFAYLVVRKAAGKFTACTVLLVLAFSRSFINLIDVIDLKCFLTALFLAGLYLVISFVKASLTGKNFYGGLPGAFLLGVVLGFLCYLEAGCAVLLLFLAGLFIGKAVDGEGKKRQAGRLLIVIAGGAAGFFGAIAEDASMSGVVFHQGLTWWADTYFSPDMDSMRLADVIWYQDYLLFAALFLMASFVVFEFIRRGREQEFSLWFLPCILVTPVFWVDFSVAGFGGVALFFWSAMAGLGLKHAAFGIRSELLREKIEGIHAMVLAEEDSEVPVPAAESSDETAPEAAGQVEAPKEKPRFIENPLPLPKKHVKREMDYDHDIPEEDMHYDIEVAEDDDFDIGTV